MSNYICELCVAAIGLSHTVYVTWNEVTVNFPDPYTSYTAIDDPDIHEALGEEHGQFLPTQTGSVGLRCVHGLSAEQAATGAYRPSFRDNTAAHTIGSRRCRLLRPRAVWS